MCIRCWEKYGSLKIDNPSVREAAARIEAVYEHHCTGGSLHIVLDDWNLEDRHLDWCAKRIGELDDTHPGEAEASRRCYLAMRPLSEAERASALAIFDGFWKPGVNPEPERR